LQIKSCKKEGGNKQAVSSRPLLVTKSTTVFLVLFAILFALILVYVIYSAVRGIRNRNSANDDESIEKNDPTADPLIQANK
jgi:hypothetical protein